MIYTENTRKAMNIAYMAHMGQLDKSGVSYIYHPIHVAEQMKTEAECIVALLHDVVEDTNITFKDFETEFPEEVIEALKLLTHDDSEEYLDYVRKLAKNPIANAVKKADLEHNSDTTRLGRELTEKDKKRLQKYEKAKAILEEYSNK